MSGYTLRHEIDRSVGFFWQESYGQLYPTLKTLAADGLVRVCSASASEGKREHRGALYELTPQGRKALSTWVARPPAPEPARSELLLKIFFAEAVPPEVMLKNLEAVAERVRGELAIFEATAAELERRGDEPPGAPYWKLTRRLTLQAGISHARTGLAWVEEAERVIRSQARVRRGRKQR